MNPRQRRIEIDMMIVWLDSAGYIDYTEKASGPTRWSIYMLNGYHHIGNAVSTHAYLSGATDIMHIEKYGRGKNGN